MTPSAVAACTPAQARLAAELLVLAGDAAAPETGEVHLPIPLAELSAESGRDRNCGTLYAHVRALARHGAVRRAPGRVGLLVDPAKLTALARPAPAGRRPPNRPDRGACGRPAPTRPTPSSPPVPADRLPAGVLTELVTLSRRVVALVEQDRASESLVAGWRDLLAVARTGLAGSEVEVTDGLDVLTASLRDVADVAGDPRNTSRTAREIADDPRRAVSPDRREGERVFPVQSSKPPSPSLREPSATLAEPASRNLADRGPRRSDDVLHDLLGPLERLADQGRLIPVTDLVGLRDALAPYSDDQVRHAVQVTRRMTQNGAIRSSPLGWLFKQAKTGNETFFPSPADLRAPRASPPPPIAKPADEPVDSEAEAAVSAMEAADDGQLRALDDWAKAAIPGAAALIAAGGIHNLRVGIYRRWRQQQPLAT